MTGKATASALRVLAVAAERELLVDRPKGVIVYARSLEPIERRWLVDGMDCTAVHQLTVHGIHGEDQEIVGYVLGRVYRVQLRRADVDALLAPAGVR